MSKLAALTERIAESAVCAYQKTETDAVRAYKAVEAAAVNSFSAVTDKCVEVLFAKSGESVADAKMRLRGKHACAPANDKADNHPL